MANNGGLRLDGKRALITGAGSGIGEATATFFAQAGAEVLVVDISQDAAERVAGRLDRAQPRACDVSDASAVSAMIGALDRLDILINNAGIGLVGSVEETELADWQRVFRVNVDGVYLMTRAALPLLLASRGSIVNLGSVAGLVGIKRRFAYCSSKGAVIAMTRQLAADYPTQLRVNCVAPGTVDTPFVEAYLEKYHRHEKEKVRAELNQRQPMGRVGRPEEIAQLILYLCSPAADFMNGAVIPIDGGWTAL